MNPPTLEFEAQLYCRYCQKPIDEGPASRFAGGASYGHMNCGLNEGDPDFFHSETIIVKYKFDRFGDEED